MTTKIPAELSSTPSIVDNGNATALTIDANENLGLASRLSVGTTTVGGGNTKVVVTGSSDNYIQLVSSTGNGGISMGNSAGPNLLFYTHTGALGAESFTERMRLTSDGNLGIRWAAPTSRLGILQNGSTTAGMNITDGASADFLVYAGYVSGTTRIGSSAGNLAIQSAGTERMRVQSGGNILLNQTATADSNVADARLEITRSSQHCINCHVGGTGNSTLVAFINDNGFVGGINTNGSNTVYNTSSDARLKNVLGEAKGLEIINGLNPVNFEWKSDGKIQDGLIAQEVEKIFPEAVSEPELKGEWYSVDYSKLVTPLIKGMQEQQTIIEDLKARIETLEAG